MSIVDYWDNVLSSGPIQVIGYRGTEDDFPFDLYQFLLTTIREADQRDVALLWRWLQPMNLHWKAQYTQIKSVIQLKSPELCPVDLLDHLRKDVGIMDDLGYIWGVLDEAEKRRLIKFFVRFLRYRSSTFGLIEMISTMTGEPVIVRGYFYYRWIISGDLDSEQETAIGREDDGYDPWLIAESGVTVGVNPDLVTINYINDEDMQYIFTIDNFVSETTELPIPTTVLIKYTGSVEPIEAVVVEESSGYKLYLPINESFSQSNTFTITGGNNVICDEYSESNQDTTSPLGNGSITVVGQSLTGDGNYLSEVEFYLSITGSPTGNVVANLYTHTGTFGVIGLPGTLLATSDDVDVTSLTGVLTMTTFTFDETFELVDGTNYFIVLEYSGGDGSNYINVGYDESSPSHNGNFVKFAGSPEFTWTSDSASDVVFSMTSLVPTVVISDLSEEPSDFQISSEPGDSTFDILIEDDGDLNRDMVKALAKFSRPLSERIYILYYLLIERFEDVEEWETDLGTAIYADNQVVLGDVAEETRIRLIQTGADEHSDYTVTVKAQFGVVDKYVQIRFMRSSSGDYYFFEITPALPPTIPVGTWRLVRVVSGIGGGTTVLDSGNLEWADVDVDYMWRIDCNTSERSGGNIQLIRVYQDENLVVEYADDPIPWSGNVHGTVEMVVEDGGDLTVSSVFINSIPMGYDYIGP